MFIFCPAAENEPKERAEGTEVPSGSLLGALKVSFGNTRIGLKGAASVTISPATGALRSEALLRAFSKFWFLQWT